VQGLKTIPRSHPGRKIFSERSNSGHERRMAKESPTLTITQNNHKLILKGPHRGRRRKPAQKDVHEQRKAQKPSVRSERGEGGGPAQRTPVEELYWKEGQTPRKGKNPDERGETAASPHKGERNVTPGITNIQGERKALRLPEKDPKGSRLERQQREEPAKTNQRVKTATRGQLKMKQSHHPLHWANHVAGNLN